MEKGVLFLEKFAILNLLKAIDGLKGLSATEKEQTPPPAEPVQSPPATQKNSEMPNIMYEALVRHERVSNRLRNRK